MTNLICIKYSDFEKAQSVLKDFKSKINKGAFTMLPIHNMPKLLLDFDVNGTIILQDTSKNANWDQMLISVLSENTVARWDESHEPMSYKNYIHNVLLPGDKSNQELKLKRRELIQNFFEWLIENNHPAKDEVFRNYELIKQKFTNIKTKQIEPKVFTSFYTLLEKLKSLHIPFIVKLRTFGDDLNFVAKEISSHENGIQFRRRGNFSGQQLYLEGEGTLEKVDAIFQTFLNSNEHFALKDDWQKWNADGERGRSAKPFIFDSTSHQKETRILSIFFDDNITGEELDIINPVEISGNLLSTKELKDTLLFKVDTVAAMKNDHYYVELLKKALVANGCDNSML